MALVCTETVPLQLEAGFSVYPVTGPDGVQVDGCRTWLEVELILPALNSQMDTSAVLQVFSFAFGTVMLFWFIAHGVGLVLQRIRQR